MFGRLKKSYSWPTATCRSQRSAAHTRDQRRRMGEYGLPSVLAHLGRRQSGSHVRGLETCKSPGEIALASTDCKHILCQYRVLSTLPQRTRGTPGTPYESSKFKLIHYPRLHMLDPLQYAPTISLQ